MTEERLQRLLAGAGLGSRRACETLIVRGQVTVDGRIVTALGTTVDPEVSQVRVNGQLIRLERFRYIVLHKPAGYLSNPDARAKHPSWQALVSVPERLFPVGRLDMDSEGLLLLTNDGELAQRLTHPSFGHSRTYLVEVEGTPNPRKVRRLQHGIMLEDGPTAPAEVILLKAPPDQANSSSLKGGKAQGSRAKATSGRVLRPSSWLKVSLREGRKRQLRRMVARLGHPAIRVIRIGLGPLELGHLPRGKWRDLWPAEVEALRSAVTRTGDTQGKGLTGTYRPEASVSTGSPSGRAQRKREDIDRVQKKLGNANRTSAASSRRLPRVIAIDGPSASGKSTVGRLVARGLGYIYFDTGAMYRAVANAALMRQIPLSDEAAITALARQLELQVLPPTVEDGRDVTVLADGVDVTWDIRSPEVERAVSPIAAYPGVREALRAVQRQVGLGGKVVMVGRDIGTAVLPEADLKIYLDASLKVRAQRRYLERSDRGEIQDFEDVLTDMRRRDEIDSTRQHAPLAAAPDAIVIDTSSLDIQGVVRQIESLLDEKRRGAK